MSSARLVPGGWNASQGKRLAYSPAFGELPRWHARAVVFSEPPDGAGDPVRTRVRAPSGFQAGRCRMIMQGDGWPVKSCSDACWKRRMTPPRSRPRLGKVALHVSGGRSLESTLPRVVTVPRTVPSGPEPHSAPPSPVSPSTSKAVAAPPALPDPNLLELARALARLMAADQDHRPQTS